jgi:hypothetical protein
MSEQRSTHEIVSVRIKPPTVLERLQSTAVTAGVALVVSVAAVFVVGLAAFVVALVTKSPMPQLTNRPVDPNDATGVLQGWTLTDSGGSGASMGGMALAVLALVSVVVWMTTCRLGRGTPGDAVMGILARDTEGRLVGRGRAMARTAAPVTILAIGMGTGLTGLGVLVVLALWAPALLRRDRRTAFDLLSGVVPQSTEPDKTSTGWTNVPVRR